MLSYPDDPSAAVTVLDPRRGFVLAMVGGDQHDYWRNRNAGRVNLATAAGGTGRQSGSSFKPFALVAALERRHVRLGDVLRSLRRCSSPSESGRVWDVTNAEGAGFGTMTLREATVHSVNTVYAQLIDQLGPRNGRRGGHAHGAPVLPEREQSDRERLQPNLSAVLGTNEVNTLEMASAYGTLATGGPSGPSRSGLHGSPMHAGRSSGRPMRLPSVSSIPRSPRSRTSILSEAVLYGTGTAANIGRPQIGKTGTAMDHSDAWFVGAIPQMVAAVWVGFPQGQVRMEPPRTRVTVFGGTWPAQIWRLLMLEASRGLPPMEFPNPDVGFVSVTVDATQEPYCLPNPFTLPQNIQTLQFIAGTEPTKVCTSPSSLQQVLIPSADRLVGTARDRGTDRGGVLRGRQDRALDAAERHGDPAGPGRGHGGVPDEHRHDHGVAGPNPRNSEEPEQPG